MLTAGSKTPTTRWINETTWTCDRHVPSAKFPARLEECCYYGCTSRRPPVPEDTPVLAPPPPVAVFVPPLFVAPPEPEPKPVTEPELKLLPEVAEEPEEPEEPITDPELPVVQAVKPPAPPRAKRSHKAKKPADEVLSQREQEKVDRDRAIIEAALAKYDGGGLPEAPPAPAPKNGRGAKFLAFVADLPDPGTNALAFGESPQGTGEPAFKYVGTEEPTPAERRQGRTTRVECKVCGAVMWRRRNEAVDRDHYCPTHRGKRG